jgi:4-hydroxybenzoate polyprenyltransferase
VGISNVAPIRAFVRASHPEPTLAVTVVAAGLAVSGGRDAPGVLAVAAAVLAGQLSIGWDNDAVDAARDRLTGRADKPAVVGTVTARGLRRAALVALAACVPLSLLSGWAPGALHLGAVGSAWLYNRPLKSTVLSALPFAVSFALLPAFVLRGLAPSWVIAAGALLGTGAHFANVLPDLEDDAATGIRGLPHRIGRTASVLAAAVLLLAASVVLAVGPPGMLRWSGAAAVAVSLAGLVVAAAWSRRPGSRLPFRMVLVVALTDVALLLASGAAVAGR